jgi:hypothetical protein
MKCHDHCVILTLLSLNIPQLKLGEIKPGSSYVPSGLSAKQYAELRSKEAKKKRENYERNVKKAGIFIDFTEWYKERGTDLKQTWKKDRNLGHTMAKVGRNSNWIVEMHTFTVHVPHLLSSFALFRPSMTGVV